MFKVIAGRVLGGGNRLRRFCMVGGCKIPGWVRSIPGKGNCFYLAMRSEKSCDALRAEVVAALSGELEHNTLLMISDEIVKVLEGLSGVLKESGDGFLSAKAIKFFVSRPYLYEALLLLFHLFDGDADDVTLEKFSGFLITGSPESHFLNAVRFMMDREAVFGVRKAYVQDHGVNGVSLLGKINKDLFEGDDVYDWSDHSVVYSVLTGFLDPKIFSEPLILHLAKIVPLVRDIGNLQDLQELYRRLELLLDRGNGFGTVTCWADEFVMDYFRSQGVHVLVEINGGLELNFLAEDVRKIGMLLSVDQMPVHQYESHFNSFEIDHREGVRALLTLFSHTDTISAFTLDSVLTELYVSQFPFENFLDVVLDFLSLQGESLFLVARVLYWRRSYIFELGQYIDDKALLPCIVRFSSAYCQLGQEYENYNDSYALLGVGSV